MTIWRVSINGEDWVEVEAPNAYDALVEVLSDEFVVKGERREIDLLIVRKAERAVVSPAVEQATKSVKAMVLDGRSGWAEPPATGKLAD